MCRIQFLEKSRKFRVSAETLMEFFSILFPVKLFKQRVTFIHSIFGAAWKVLNVVSSKEKSPTVKEYLKDVQT